MAKKPQASKSWQKAAASRTGSAKPMPSLPGKKKGLVIVIGIGKKKAK